MLNSKSTIPPEIAERLLRADLANVVRKLRAGKTLTRAERQLIEAHGNDTAGTVKTITKLAEILGVTRRTLQTWRKMEDAPKPANGEHDVSAWEDFRSKHGLKGYSDTEDPEDEQGLPSEPLLRRRKLHLFCQEKEIQLAAKRGELIEQELVRETWSTKTKQADTILRGLLTERLARKLEASEAYEIYDELVAVVDEFVGMMHSGKS